MAGGPHADLEAAWHARTMLFVPGHRADRFAKAHDAGADAVIIDLEDGCPVDERAAARTAIAAFLPDHPCFVRVNPYDDADRSELERDLAALEPVSASLQGVVLPKAESADGVRHLHDRLGVPVLAIIESAAGAWALRQIAAAPGLGRLAFGALDFAADTGGGGTLLDVVRADVVVASRAHGLPAPLDTPAVEIEDVDAVERSAREGVQVGMGGKFAIHPRQVPIIEQAWMPSADDLAWARRIAQAGDGASRVDGIMVDAPVLTRARRILAAAGETPG